MEDLELEVTSGPKEPMDYELDEKVESSKGMEGQSDATSGMVNQPTFISFSQDISNKHH